MIGILPNLAKGFFTLFTILLKYFKTVNGNCIPSIKDAHYQTQTDSLPLYMQDYPNVGVSGLVKRYTCVSHSLSSIAESFSFFFFMVSVRIVYLVL